LQVNKKAMTQFSVPTGSREAKIAREDIAIAFGLSKKVRWRDRRCHQWTGLTSEVTVRLVSVVGRSLGRLNI
jgi:hypothetical protein